MSEPIPDPLLTQLSTDLEPVAAKLNASDDHALFVLGAKHVPNPDDPDQYGVHTFFAVSGYYELLAEGMYAELREMIEEGNPTLFYMLREVITDLQVDLDIPEPGESMEGGGNGQTLH